MKSDKENEGRKRLKNNMYTLLVLIVLRMQYPVNPLEGYNELVKIRTSSPIEWKSNREVYLNQLVKLSVSLKNERNQLLPIIFIHKGDTTKKVFYLKDLQKLKRKELEQLRYVNHRPPIQIFGYEILNDSKSIDFDSILFNMSQNILINSSEFDWKLFESGGYSAECCEFEVHSEKISFIYKAFNEGILFEEDDSSGGLYHVPY